MDHLLAIALGPVQEFIATARRTRDLFAGSRLLSEAAACAAKALAKEVGVQNLIFPAPESEAALETPVPAPESEATHKTLAEAGIPNVLLVRVPEGKDPKGLGEKALKAAKDCLLARAREVFTPRKDHLLWEEALEQVKDLLEGYYAYLPLKGDYPGARERLMALLAARKNTRDFAPASWGSPAYKSSLDGARESVLRLPQEGADRLRVRLGLRPGEYLSGPDLLKRWWQTKHGFLSTTHVAALPFFEGVRRVGQEELLRRALEDLAQLAGEEARAGTYHPVLRDTPFAKWDVRLLYETRLAEFPALAEDSGLLERARARLRELWRALSQKGVRAPPGAYYALLHADGDRMGEALDRLKTPEAHRRFSKTLALQFAAEVKGLVEAHGGALVYSGGDDVLALLPLHKALMTAKALAERFREVMAPFGGPEKAPSLSVGLAVVHHLEPLQDALDLARRAEKQAKEGKPQRNALCVAYSPRSGSERMARGRWDEKPPLTRRLLRYADLQRAGEVPSRAAYELSALVREAGDALPDEALVAEALRILGRREMRQAYREELEAWLRTGEDVRRLAGELLLARPFAEALDQAGVPVESREVWDAH
ncbi:type III-B CRISPR-associated protein Cas10/Cmr2 [Thermus sp.]|uniref:type III-B CRISPR-associated protein Cas10/Cmr2 n=1 Tax=Thermus sp. TaxID=275 RepID=UPI003D0B2FBC